MTTMTATETSTRIAYIRVVMLASCGPNMGEVIEVHAIPYDEGYWAMRKKVREILGQWMEGGDRMRNLETSRWKSGETCAPYVIDTEDGEQSDIFAQLIF